MPFSGVIALVGLPAICFLNDDSKIMKTDRLEFPDKVGGAIVAALAKI